MTTPLDLIEQVAANTPDADALVYIPNPGQSAHMTVSYADLARDVRRAAQALTAAGVQKGDVVGLQLLTTPEAIIAYFAAATVATAFPVNILLTPDALQTQLNTANVRHMITMADIDMLPLTSKVRGLDHDFDLIVELPMGATAEARAPWDGFLTSGDGTDQITRNAPDDIGALFSTGGTTGAPKLAVLSVKAIIEGGRAVAKGNGFLSSDRMLSGFPMFHVGGGIAVSLGALHVGSAQIIASPLGARHPGFAPAFWSMVQDYKVSVLALVPTTLGAVAQLPVGDADISSLQAILTGGARMPETVTALIEGVTGVEVNELYGMTEVGAAGAMSPRGDRIHGSAGYALPGVEIVIGDTHDTPKPQGEIGEVHMRSIGNFNGYLGKQDTSRQQPWVASGDLGYLDENGRVFITGRSKDIIIRSGHNINPQVLEGPAETHPAVDLAAAVPYPDDYAGELPVLYVQLVAGSTATADDIRDYVAERVEEPPAKPKHVFIIDEMPLTNIGKIFKPALRERAQDHAKAQAG